MPYIYICSEIWQTLFEKGGMRKGGGIEI
jgi:hypothetical protein